MLGQFLSAISNFILGTIGALGYLGIFLLMIPGGANIPIPSEIIMTFSGFLVGIGKLKFWPVVLVGVLGDLTGSLISYFSARRLDGRLRKNHDFQRAERWFKRFGEVSIFLGRMVPIARTFISFPAGMFKVRLWRFFLLTLAGSFLWVIFLTYLGLLLGENWKNLEPYFRKFDFLIAGFILIAILWWLRHHFRKADKST